jgi:hypothetical protein
LDGRNKKIEVEAVLRDSSREVLEALSTTVSYINDSYVAKAMVAWKAVTFFM